MTQAEKIIKIIMPDLLRYLNMKKSGINLAIIGMGYTALDKSKRRTILVSAIEHKCVLGASRFLERFGFTIKKIPVKHDGIIDFEALNELLTDDVNSLI